MLFFQTTLSPTLTSNGLVLLVRDPVTEPVFTVTVGPKSVGGVPVSAGRYLTVIVNVRLETAETV
jgi:hypothetical protein